MLNAVSNFTVHYQTAASAATPSSLFSTGWVFPVKGKCAAWPSHWTCLFLASSFLCVSNSGHRFLYNLFFRRAALLFASRSRFSLSTVSVLLSPLHTLALVSQRALIRSFVCSKTDRPSRTSGICRWQNCRSSSAAFVFSQSSSCVFHSLTPSTLLRNQICRARPPRTPRRCRPPAVVAQVDLLSTLQDVSTNLRYLRVSSNRLSLTKAPIQNRRGRRHRTRLSRSHTHNTSRQEQFWREKNYNPIQADTTFDTVQRHHHLTHY